MGEVKALLAAITAHPFGAINAISVHNLFVTQPCHFKPNLIFGLNAAHKTLPTKAGKGIGMVVWIQFNRFRISHFYNEQAGHIQAGHLQYAISQCLLGIS